MDIIVRIEDKYLIWSDIVDAPITSGMTLEELEAHCVAEHGDFYGNLHFYLLLQRIERSGTSNPLGLTPEDVISGNRAGPGGTELTMEEIRRAYCLYEPIRNGWTVPWLAETRV